MSVFSLLSVFLLFYPLLLSGERSIDCLSSQQEGSGAEPSLSETAHLKDGDSQSELAHRHTRTHTSFWSFFFVIIIDQTLTLVLLDVITVEVLDNKISLECDVSIIHQQKNIDVSKEIPVNVLTNQLHCFGNFYETKSNQRVIISQVRTSSAASTNVFISGCIRLYPASFWRLGP